MSNVLRQNAADEWHAAETVTTDRSETAVVAFKVARARYNHADAEGVEYA